MRIEVWGKNGKVIADRQECQVYLRDGAIPDFGLDEGWTMRYAPS